MRVFPTLGWIFFERENFFTTSGSKNEKAVFESAPLGSKKQNNMLTYDVDEFDPAMLSGSFEHTFNVHETIGNDAEMQFEVLVSYDESLNIATIQNQYPA